MTGQEITALLKKIGAKNIYICCGETAAKKEVENRGGEANGFHNPHPKCFVEISWGSGDSAEFDYARCSTGKSLPNAIKQCLFPFQSEMEKQIAEKFGLTPTVLKQIVNAIH